VDPLFPQLPQDITGLDDEQLAALREDYRTRIRHVAEHKRDPDVVADRTQTQVAEEMQAAVSELATLESEIESRESEKAEYDETVDELAQKAGVELKAETPDQDTPEDETPDEDAPESEATAETEEVAAETEETVAEEKPVAVTASRRRPLPAARRHKPTPQMQDTSGVRAMVADNVLSIERLDLLDRKRLGELMNQAIRKGRVAPGDKMTLASATYDYPAERQLDRERELNMDKINAVLPGGTPNPGAISPETLVASGALCAPLTPIYDLPGVETAVRPVRDALPSFQANRGGVIVGGTPIMGDYDEAVGIVTAADNEAGGTFATKSCMRIECPTFEEKQVDAIYTCTEADNLAAKAYPELMARIDELVRATQAREADGKLLTEMAAGSTAVTGGAATAGALYYFLGDIVRLAAGMRSRHRMPEAARLRALLPTWIIDLLALDIARGQFDRFQTRASIESILENYGINAVFYLDGSSTATDGQVFGVQTAGAILDFPDTVEWFLFPEGTWLHLDAGVLDLGIVRDSVLNSTNDFQVFAETWEQVAYVGVESLVVTSTVCPTGEVAAPTETVVAC
jgi:hypothetical protein